MSTARDRPPAAAPAPEDRSDPARAVARQLDGRAVAVAESCTAGRIAASLAAVERATEFLRGGLTAYQEEVKRTLLGVRADSVLSEEAAAEMAAGIAQLLQAEVAVGTTGVAGDAAIDGVEPGTVFVATRVDGTTRCTTLHLDGDPDEVCDRAAHRALALLAEHLASGEAPG